MFNGEERARVPDQGGEDATFDFIKESLRDLGHVRITSRGSIDILPRPSLQGTFSQTMMQGSIRTRKGGEYEMSINYTCSLSVLGWVVCILGFPLGLLIIMAPTMLRTEVSRRTRRTLEYLEDEDTSRGNSAPLTRPVATPLHQSSPKKPSSPSKSTAACPGCSRVVSGALGRRYCMICDLTY